MEKLNTWIYLEHYIISHVRGRSLRVSPDELEQVIIRFVQSSQRYGFEFYLIQEPTEGAVYPDLSSTFTDYGPRYERIEEISDRLGIPLIDPVPLFRENRGQELFLDFVHLRPEGHRLIAEAIYHEFENSVFRSGAMVDNGK